MIIYTLKIFCKARIFQLQKWQWYKNTSNELEELRNLIADTENVKKDISSEHKY